MTGRGASGYDPSVFSHNWEPATAKIIAKKFKEGGERSGVWEYVADVTPASGEVFRTKLLIFNCGCLPG